MPDLGGAELDGGGPFDVRHSGRLSHTGAKVDLKGKILRVVVVRVAVVVVAVVTVRILARQGRAGTRQEDWPSPMFLDELAVAGCAAWLQGRA